MRNLWVFGDSYSCDWNKVVAKGHKEYVEKYNPISHFSNIIKDTYQFDKIYNISESGNCNYSILESICKYINDIEDTDYVIIGWSEITRWRCLSLNKNKWKVVGVNFNEASTELRNESISRDSKITIDEVNNWITLLNKTLPNQILHWTPFQSLKNDLGLNVCTPPFHMKRINEEYNIKDTHITEEGHIDISKWMIDIINDKPITKKVI